MALFVQKTRKLRRLSMAKLCVLVLASYPQINISCKIAQVSSKSFPFLAVVVFLVSCSFAGIC